MITTCQALDQIHAILATPDVWTKDTLCSSKTGDRNVGLEEADCFCLFGAECRVLQPIPISDRPRNVNTYLRMAIRELFPHREDTLPGFNDNPNTTHADVLAVVARAQEMADR